MKELKIFYFDLPHAIQVHDMIIEISGGMPGYDADKVRMLESTLAHIQNDLYYPTFLDKIAHLLYSINKSHAFFDGNKRSSLALSAYLLQINGYDYCITDFILRMENIVVWVADNKIEKDLLKDIIEDIIMEQERESVQLALIHALSLKCDT
ncbi:MAG: Fic family protein [Alphaproteobacteria bacterium]|nr:Fic family protein [Alphaproteobacteria bacterium]